MPLITWMAKRVIRARIAERAVSAAEGDALAGVQVEYALPAHPDRVCVYLGRARSSRAPSTAEHNTLYREDVLVDVRIRVSLPGGDIEEAEGTVEDIANRIADVVSQEPRLAGPGGTVAVSVVDQDPTIVSPDPDSTVTVNAVLTVSLSAMVAGV